jgi:hypothetical protein
VAPIRPADIPATKRKVLPPAVLECWNDLIARNYSGGSAEIKGHLAAEALMEAMGVDRATVLQEGWLDIEEIYRDAGWTVVYDKPAYNESYDAFFTFRG